VSSWNVSLQKMTGAPLRRINIPWSTVQPTPGTWNWSTYDAEYQTALRGGLQPLIMLFTAPCWARPGTACSSTVTGPPAPAYQSYWVQFVRQATLRYPRAVGIEIWNEPNLDFMWTPIADGAGYAQLLKISYPAVKAVNPSMPVVSAGLDALDIPGRGTIGEGDKSYLTAMLSAGAGNYLDAIGLHPYPWQPDGTGWYVWSPISLANTLDRDRAVRNSFGLSKPFWITEIGESTATQTGFPPAVSPQQQRTDLVAMLQMAQAAPDVPVFIVHTIMDFFSTNPVESGFGVFTYTGAAKPAACGLSAALGGTLHC
jgi:hypothetical protein